MTDADAFSALSDDPLAGEAIAPAVLASSPQGHAVKLICDNVSRCYLYRPGAAPEGGKWVSLPKGHDGVVGAICIAVERLRG